MAIYHLHASYVTRGTGRSSVSSAAYICGEKLYEDRRGITANYTNKSHVLLYKTIAPENSKYTDLSVWNAIENFEDYYAEHRYKNDKAAYNYKATAQTAMSIVVSLPNELSDKNNQELIEDFIQKRFTSRGLITTYAIHNPEGNTHAHLQICLRPINSDGDFSNAKDREICRKSSLIETRKLWSDLSNNMLKREGHLSRITEKSYADLEINLEAQTYIGYTAVKIGKHSDRVWEHQEIAKINNETILSNPDVMVDYLNKHKAVFTKNDAVRELFKRGLNEEEAGMALEHILDKCKYAGENMQGEVVYTGERYEQSETNVINLYKELLGETTKIKCKVRYIEDLSEEQNKAIELLCGRERIGLLIGKAGTGKTTTMKAVSDIYKEAGSRVIGMSSGRKSGTRCGNREQDNRLLVALLEDIR